MGNPASRAIGILTLVGGLFLSLGTAQQGAISDDEEANLTHSPAKRNSDGKKEKPLTADDGLSIIAAALDGNVRRHSGGDCSHLVHAIYEKAGFPYKYASSSDLYDGVEGFRRVSHPQPGDVIVWEGHAGIVVRPSRHIFFSFKSAGPGIDDYEAPYWRSRGHARFYRYIQNHPCSGCATISDATRRTRPN